VPGSYYGQSKWRHGKHAESNILIDVTRTLHLSKFVTSQQVDVHVDSLFQRRNFLENSTNTYEGLYITAAKDGRETFAKRREHRDRTPHLIAW
jgi:hypothetical protein